jgi:hypothetical protein
MVKAGMIEQVPGTRTANTAYRRPVSIKAKGPEQSTFEEKFE